MNKNFEEPNASARIYPGPIRHKELSPEFIARVKDYKYKLREVERSSLEETLDGFQRDTHPEAELVIWEKIATSYDVTVKYNPIWNMRQKEKAFAEILNSTQ